jgi:hypothetical protein
VTAGSGKRQGRCEAESVAVIGTYHASVNGSLFSNDKIGTCICGQGAPQNEDGRNSQSENSFHVVSIIDSHKYNKLFANSAYPGFYQKQFPVFVGNDTIFVLLNANGIGNSGPGCIGWLDRIRPLFTIQKMTAAKKADSQNDQRRYNISSLHN